MKHCRFVLGIALGTLAASTIGWGAVVTAARPEATIRMMPPNEAKLMASMLSKYHLKVDDANPAAQRKWDGRIVRGGVTVVTTAAAQDVVRQYLQAKFGAKPKDQPNPLQRRQLSGSGAENPAQLRSVATADSFTADQSSNCPVKSGLKTDNILVLLVEFSDVIHNQLPQPAKENKLDYWVSDFSATHYQNMLFSRDQKALTMRNYFLEQSNGLFTVDGKVLNWVKVNLPESSYGADSASGGNDNANGPVWRIVKDALQAAGSKVNWAQYDQEDPRDLDNDGNIQEPDGYIDHLMLVHSGAGQEAGGGEQGDDAIWSHSGWANGGGTDGPGMGGVPTSDPKVFAGPYTIMPEDGSIGVFCHEFTHDLGLPDEYDTIYSGEASTAFWSLMSSGSWSGIPLGTKPSGISIWGRIQLGWVKPQVVPYQSADKLLWLDRNGKLLNNQAIRINLPDKKVQIDTNTPFSGKYEWYSGAGDDLNQTLTRELDLTKVSQATLKFQTWYNIEEDYDFGFVEVSQDNGKTWVNLPGNLTRTWEGANVLTGASTGWVEAGYDLGKYVGSKIVLRFRYYTDGGYTLPGWAIDDIRIEAIGFTDTVEAGAGSWVARGWRIYEGKETVAKEQYYLLEQRNHQGFDQCLAQIPSVYATDLADYYSYQPGVLLWLVDNEYTDNWVGKHPGHGYLLVVDSHPEPDLFGTKVFRTRIQIRDASFGLQPTKPVTLTVSVNDELQKAELKARRPSSRFSDSQSYWMKTQPDNSSIVPQYGVNFQVLATSPDHANSLIYIYFRK